MELKLSLILIPLCLFLSFSDIANAQKKTSTTSMKRQQPQMLLGSLIRQGKQFRTNMNQVFRFLSTQASSNDMQFRCMGGGSGGLFGGSSGGGSSGGSSSGGGMFGGLFGGSGGGSSGGSFGGGSSGGCGGGSSSGGSNGGWSGGSSGSGGLFGGLFNGGMGGGSSGSGSGSGSGGLFGGLLGGGGSGSGSGGLLGGLLGGGGGGGGLLSGGIPGPLSVLLGNLGQVLDSLLSSVVGLLNRLFMSLSTGLIFG